MLVPFVSSNVSLRKLYRRKGGGGGGAKSGGSSSSGSKGSSGGSSSSGKTGSSSSSKTGSSSSSKGGSSGKSSSGRTVPVTTGSGSSSSTKSATSYGYGGGKVVTIPSGQLFSGRTQGGGTRQQVFGTREYGSGYPGIVGRGVSGRGFPFFFWPIVWVGALGGDTSYLEDNEYGSPDNSSRPGGPMMTAAFQSNSTNTTFHVVADNATVTDLIADINANCSSSLNTSSSSQTPLAFNSSSTDAPQPGQVVQYYRASSVALTLDGYNDTADYAAEGTPDTPLPSNIDTTLLDCLNQTIGLAVPLINGADSIWSTPNHLMALVVVMSWLLSLR